MKNLRSSDEQIVEMAARLRMTYTRDNLAELMETAARAGMTPRETLGFVLEREIAQRETNMVKLATMSAHFPYKATISGFDPSFQPSLRPGLMRELISLEWLRARENVIFIGPSGVGKTHLSIALGQLALEKGVSVRFHNALHLSQQLEKAYLSGGLDQKLKEVNKARLLILDELGLMPLTVLQGQLFLQLVSSRYERKSIIITSNKTTGEWGVVFGDAVAAMAAIDRLVHHSVIVPIKGESYRAKECRMNQELRRQREEEEEKASR